MRVRVPSAAPIYVDIPTIRTYNMGMKSSEKWGRTGSETTEKSDEQLAEETIVKTVCNTIFKSLVVVILTFGGCSMHSNMFDDDRLLAEAALATAKGEATVKKAEAELEQIKAIERLVAAGIDPAGARCAIKGDECRNGNFSVTVTTPVIEVETETSATPAE